MYGKGAKWGEGLTATDVATDVGGAIIPAGTAENLSLDVVPKTLGEIPTVPSSVVPEAFSSGADAVGAYTGTAAQNRELLSAGNYGGTSIIDALKKAGLGSSLEERAEMYSNLFGSQQYASNPFSSQQIAGGQLNFKGGGMVRRNPRTLLSFIG